MTGRQRRFGRASRARVRTTESWHFWLSITTMVVAAVVVLVTTGLLASDSPLRLHLALARGVEALSGDHLTLGLVESLLVLVLVVYCVRRLVLAWLAYSPGPVEVIDFVDDMLPGQGELSGAGDGEAVTGWSPSTPPAPRALAVTNRFREVLTQIELYPPTAMPRNAPSVQFLELLRTSAGDKSEALAGVVGFMALMRPTHAYRVTGTLQRRPPASAPDGVSVFGLSVQVTVLPTGTTAVDTYWASSVERIIQKGAHGVAAFIVPRSRASLRPPWRSWRGLRLDGRLYDTFRTVKRLQLERRLDEALGTLSELLREDPLNIDLKVEFGTMLEQTGLFVDALSVYADAVAAVEASRAGGSTGVVRRLERLSGKRPSHAGLGPRYLLALTLSAVPKVSAQWLETRDVGPERARERREVRARLREWLVARYEQTARTEPTLSEFDVTELLTTEEDLQRTTRRRDDAAQERADRTRQLKEAPPGSRDHRVLRLLVDMFFLVASRQERLGVLEELRLPVARRDLLLTRRSARIGLLLIDQRLEGLQVELAATRGSWSEEQVRSRVESLSRVHVKLDQVLCPRLRRASREYQEHYNAACVLGVAFSSLSSLRQADQGTLAEVFDEASAAVADQAMSRLERAVSCADSAFLSGRRDWILSGDPDLQLLRTHPRFEVFEAKYFATGERPLPRPANVQRYEASRYVAHLVRDVARARARLWHDRRVQHDRVPADPWELERWWHEEITVCDRLRVTAENSRHWRTRLALITTLNEGAELGHGPFQVRHPTLPEATHPRPQDGVHDVHVLEERHEQRVKADLVRLVAVLAPSTGESGPPRPGASSGSEPPPSGASSTGGASQDKDRGRRTLHDIDEAWLRYFQQKGRAGAPTLGVDDVVGLCQAREWLWDTLAQRFSDPPSKTWKQFRPLVTRHPGPPHRPRQAASASVPSPYPEQQTAAGAAAERASSQRTAATTTTGSRAG